MKDKNKTSSQNALDAVEDAQLSAISAYDCTGLIPSKITSEEQAEAYEQLYPYLAQPASPDDGKE